MGPASDDSYLKGNSIRRYFVFVLLTAIVYTGYLWLRDQYYYGRVSNLVSHYKTQTAALSRHLDETRGALQIADESARLATAAKLRRNGKPWQALEQLAAFTPGDHVRDYYREAITCVFSPGCEHAGNLLLPKVAILGISPSKHLLLGRIEEPDGEPRGVGIVVFYTRDTSREPTRHRPTWRADAAKGESPPRAVFHPSKDRVAIYHAGRIHVWDPVTDVDVARADVGKLVGKLSYSSTGKFLILGDSVFDAQTLKKTGDLPGKIDRSLDDDRLLLRSDDSWIEYDLNDGRVIAADKFIPPPENLEPISSEQDGLVIPMRQPGAPDEGVILWHRRLGKVVGKIAAVPAWGKKGRLRPILISHDGKVAVFPDAGHINSVVVWDVERGREMRRLPGALTIRLADQSLVMMQNALSTNGRFLVLFQEAQEIGVEAWVKQKLPMLSVYELPTGQRIGGAGWPAGWSRDGTLLVAKVPNGVAADGVPPKLLADPHPAWKDLVSIWRIRGTPPTVEMGRPILFLSLASDGELTVNGSVFRLKIADQRYQLVPLQSTNADMVHRAGKDRRLFLKLAASGRGKSIEIGGAEGRKTTSLPFPDYSEPLGFKPRPADGIDAFGLSPSGKYLCLAYSLAGPKEPHDVLLEVWCLAASRPFRMIDPVLIEAGVLDNRRANRSFHYYETSHASKERFGRVAFSDDEREVILLGDNGNVVKLNIGTREADLNRNPGLDFARLAVPFSFGQRWLVAASSHLSIMSWDGRVNARMALEEMGEVRAACVSPCGRFAAVGTTNGDICLLRLDNLEVVVDWLGHDEAVSAIAFSEDGRYLVTGTPAGKLRLWDLQTAERELTLVGISLPWGSAPPWDASALQHARTKKLTGLYFADRLTAKELRRDLKTIADKRVRESITERIETYKEDPMEINNIAWSYVRLPGLSLDEYQRALDWSLRSNELSGFRNLAYLNTLGVAYYRMGQYDKAIELLTKTYRQQSHPADVAFLAMAHARSGNQKHARRLHGELLDLQKRAALDWEGIRFLRELEAVLEGKAVN